MNLRAGRLSSTEIKKTMAPLHIVHITAEMAPIAKARLARPVTVVVVYAEGRYAEVLSDGGCAAQSHHATRSHVSN